MAPQFLVGTSGWNYRDWAGRFYPRDLPQRAWLDRYAQEFDTTEVNNTFYMLPAAATFDRWRRTVPPRFVFAVKASRLVTHMTKLADGRPYLANFLQRARRLGRRLGPVLFQLPGNWTANVPRLREFVERLPRGRYVFEFRHESWLQRDVLAVLERHGIGFCCFDMGGMRWPVHVTADFAYMRFHGPTARKYTGSYSRRALERWIRRLRAAAAGIAEVYVYFNNDVRGHAVANARTFRQLLG